MTSVLVQHGRSFIAGSSGYPQRTQHEVGHGYSRKGHSKSTTFTSAPSMIETFEPNQGSNVHLTIFYSLITMEAAIDNSVTPSRIENMKLSTLSMTSPTVIKLPSAPKVASSLSCEDSHGQQYSISWFPFIFRAIYQDHLSQSNWSHRNGSLWRPCPARSWLTLNSSRTLGLVPIEVFSHVKGEGNISQYLQREPRQNQLNSRWQPIGWLVLNEEEEILIILIPSRLLNHSCLSNG